MEVQMVIEMCVNCGIPFAMTQDLKDKLLKCHNTFYCPNGHGQHYTGKSDEQILRERIAEKDRTIEYFRKQEAERTAEYKKKFEAKQKKLKAARAKAKSKK